MALHEQSATFVVVEPWLTHLAVDWVALTVPPSAVFPFPRSLAALILFGGILALHAHCTLLLDYVPPKSPQARPLETPLELERYC